MSVAPGAPGVPTLVYKFDNTLGALLLGGLVAMALWGVTCVQTYHYFMSKNKDRLLTRAMVGFMWILDTFDSALNAHILYYYMVSNYLNPFAIFKPVWSIIIHVAVTSISNFLVRTMFAQRIFRLSGGNIWLTVCVMVISLCDLVVGITITVKAFGIQSFPELDKLSTLMYMTFGFGTGSDLTVAIILSWILRKSRTGFRRTDSLIKVLMMYVVNTGMIVAIDASLGMILYAVMPNNFIFLAFYLLLSKLYLNAYLATLNAREYLRQSDDALSLNVSYLTNQQRTDLERNSIPAAAEKVPGSSDTKAFSVETLIDRKMDLEMLPRRGVSDSVPRVYAI